jgi:hypothetical protein
MDRRKRAAKPPVKTGNPEVSHLDQQLTEVTRAAVAQAKRWRNAIVLGLAILILGAAAYTIVGALAESQVKGFNERLFHLVDSSTAQKDDHVVDRAEVDRLLEDVRGKTSEAYVVRRLTDYFLGKAEQLARKKEPSIAAAPGSVLPATTPVNPADIEAHWDQALRLADQAAQRFPDDAEIQTWAVKVKSRIEGERKKDWLPKGWKYTLPQPQSVPSETPPDTQPPPAPNAPAPAAEAGQAQPPPSAASAETK